jgi:hypothetical protein
VAWLEQPDGDGKVHQADCSGLLVYTGDGDVSESTAAANFGPVQYAEGG